MEQVKACISNQFPGGAGNLPGEPHFENDYTKLECVYMTISVEILSAWIGWAHSRSLVYLTFLPFWNTTK